MGCEGFESAGFGCHRLRVTTPAQVKTEGPRAQDEQAAKAACDQALAQLELAKRAKEDARAKLEAVAVAEIEAETAASDQLVAEERAVAALELAAEKAEAAHLAASQRTAQLESEANEAGPRAARGRR